MDALSNSSKPKIRGSKNQNQKRNEPDPDRTDDLEVWNLTRYRCATGPILIYIHVLVRNLYYNFQIRRQRLITS